MCLHNIQSPLLTFLKAPYIGGSLKIQITMDTSHAKRTKTKGEAQKARKVQKVMLTVAGSFPVLQGRLQTAISPFLLTQIGSNIP